GVPMTALVRAARWAAAWAAFRIRAWHAARVAWINGDDLLTALPPARAELREPCPLCGGRHCAGCEEPARVTSLATGYTARHDFSEVPPSLQLLASRVHLTVRGAPITASLFRRPVWR